MPSQPSICPCCGSFDVEDLRCNSCGHAMEHNAIPPPVHSVVPRIATKVSSVPSVEPRCSSTVLSAVARRTQPLASANDAPLITNAYIGPSNIVNGAVSRTPSALTRVGSAEPGCALNAPSVVLRQKHSTDSARCVASTARGS